MVSVSVSPVGEGATLAEFGPQLSQELSQRWGDYELVSEGEITLGDGTLAYEIVFSGTMVGPTGMVYALDNEPVHVAILWLRAKIGRLKNLKVILSDAKVTGLGDESVDVVFICDAFHEFPDKQGTPRELYRVLKSGGTLAMWEESERTMKKLLPVIQSADLFSLVEEDKAFCRLEKQPPTQT